MDNILNIGRLWKLLRKDVTEFYRNTIMVSLAFLGVYVVIWLFSLVLGIGFDVYSRGPVLIFICAAYFLYLPFKAYGYANDRRKGITYAMLPASFVEKFIIMLLACSFIYPLLFVAAMLLVDTLLVLLPGDTFINMLWKELDWSALELYYRLFMIQSAAYFGTFFFRRHKAAKTILCFMLVHLVITCIFLIGFAKDISGIIAISEDSARDAFLDYIDDTWYNVLWGLYSIGGPVVLYILSLLKIKNLQLR